MKRGEMAEHILRYDRFAEELAQEGYLVYGEDHLGHGRTANSMDEIGYMDDVDNLMGIIREIKLVIDSAKTEFPDLPVYQFAHSMGSLIALRYIELYPDDIDRLILSGSTACSILHRAGRMIAKSIMKKKGRRYKSKLLDDLSFGSFNKPFKPARTSFDWLSSNESEVDKYVEDPFCGGLFSASFFYDFTNMIIEAAKKKNMALIRNNFPIHLIAGSQDPVGDNGKGIKALHKQLEKFKANATYKLYQKARHELLNEREEVRTEVVRDILDFFNQNQ